MALSFSFERVTIAGLLVAFFAIAWSSSLFQGQTFDEGVHLASGYMHLARGDFRINPEHPPFAKMVAAIPLLFYSPVIGGDEEVSLRGEFSFATKTITSQPRGRILLGLGRLSILFFNVLIGIALYRFAGELFGIAGGLLALALFAFSTVIVAHAPLVNTDLPVVFFIIWTLHGLLRINQGHEKSGFALIAFGVGGGLATKFSYLLFVPLFAIVSLAICLQPLWQRLFGLALHRLAMILSAVLSGYVLLWLIYLVPQIWGRQTDYVMTGLLPGPWLQGLEFSFAHFQDRPLYVLGRTIFEPWPYYFAFAFLVKSSIPLLVLLALAILLVLVICWRVPDALIFSVLPLMYVFAVYTLVDIQIGIRHFLPAYAFAFVFAAGLTSFPLRRPLVRKALSLIIAFHAISCLLVYPWYLPSFNAIAYAFGRPIDVLGDSNLDWGQGLPALRRWQKSNNDVPVALSYFGTDDPNRYGLKFSPLLGYGNTFHTDHWLSYAKTPMVGTFAVSVTNLQGIYLERELGFNVFAGLREIEPVAKPAQAIYVYQLYQPGKTLVQGAIDFYLRQAKSPDAPHDVEFKLACALMEDGQYASALPVLENYLRTHVNDALALSRLGVAKLALGNPREALRHLARAASIRPNEARILYNLAGAYYELGQYRAARKYYLRADGVFPEYIDAAEMAQACLKKMPQPATKPVIAPATTAATTQSLTTTAPTP